MNTSPCKVLILHLRIEHENKKNTGFPDSRESDRKMLLKKTVQLAAPFFGLCCLCANEIHVYNKD